MCCYSFGCPSCCRFANAKTSKLVIAIAMLALVAMLVLGILGIIYTVNVNRDFNRVKCSVYLFLDDAI